MLKKFRSFCLSLIMYILIAEDDRFLAQAYSAGLEAKGYEVGIASDGKEALDMIEERKPDLLLLDILMPEVNEFDVLEALQKKGSEVLVVVMSNLGQDSDIDKARSLGAVDYMVKANHSMADVVAVVEKYAGK